MANDWCGQSELTPDSLSHLTSHQHLPPPIVRTVVALTFRASDTIASARPGEVVPVTVVAADPDVRSVTGTTPIPRER